MAIFGAVALGLVILVGRWQGSEVELQRLHWETTAVLEQLPVGVLVANQKGIIEFRNSAFDTMVGTPSRQGLSLSECRDSRVYTTTRLVDGREIPTDERPLSRALKGETVRDERVAVLSRQAGRAWDVGTGRRIGRRPAWPDPRISLTQHNVGRRRRGLTSARPGTRLTAAPLQSQTDEARKRGRPDR